MFDADMTPEQIRQYNITQVVLNFNTSNANAALRYNDELWRNREDTTQALVRLGLTQAEIESLLNGIRTDDHQV